MCLIPETRVLTSMKVLRRFGARADVPHPGNTRIRLHNLFEGNCERKAGLLSYRWRGPICWNRSKGNGEDI